MTTSTSIMDDIFLAKDESEKITASNWIKTHCGLKIDKDQCGIRYKFNHKDKKCTTVGIFDHEMNRRNDLFIIVSSGIDRLNTGKTFKRPGSGWRLVMFSANTVNNPDEYSISVFKKSNWAKYEYDIKNAMLVFDEYDGLTESSIIKPYKIAKKETPKFYDLDNLAGDDIRAERLTARDYACIHMSIPKSGKAWLNELIVENNNHDI